MLSDKSAAVDYFGTEQKLERNGSGRDRRGGIRAIQIYGHKGKE